MAGGYGPVEWGVTDWYSLAHVTILVGGATLLLKATVKNALKSRKKDIQSKLIETKAELERIEKRIAEARSEIAKIDETKKKLITEVENQGRTLATQLIDDAEKTAKQILEDAKLASQTESQELQLKLRQEVVEEAMKKTVEILKSNDSTGSKKIHDQLVERFVREGSRSFHV